jgi:hypothetical protein
MQVIVVRHGLEAIASFRLEEDVVRNGSTEGSDAASLQIGKATTRSGIAVAHG